MYLNGIGSGAENARENPSGPSGPEIENVRENSTRPSTPEAENARENSTGQPPASWWNEHDLHAIPGLENASVEDLPTAEEVENILFNWPVFENIWTGCWIDWNGSYQDVLNILKDFNIEYHFGENNKLIINTPGIFYKKPGEPIPDWMTLYDNSEYRIWNYSDTLNSLYCSRYLDNLGIRNGIAIIPVFTATPPLIEAKVVVPVRKGLAYYIPTAGERAHWAGIWYALNLKPGGSNPYYTDPESEPLGDIEIHWRLGEGEYVDWLYTPQDGEPVMTWSDNGEPVDW
ncbi:hypothetical protein AKJ44_01560 [candidate division MSBL1 archaeon SCGC-AAA261F17]|uniref:Uncharacterized protein n=1 Tax=candidate division MSBL1 archaeon SCGC-AAA261F17 TaxID=1698274 RepID=A0A133V6J1_9EURY|nr:hypothetical protein AKJ44_01560 [candidate division MSBL1 archaeon SCGC-AAA261F17]